MNKQAGLLAVLITLACQSCHATRIIMSNASSEYKLRQELLTGYDPLVRPVLSPLTVVNVSFLVQVINIVDVDSKKEIITSKILIEQRWENPYLRWDQSLFDGIERVRMSSKEVWVPDIKLKNMASNPSQDTEHLHENWVTVFSNGTNVWVSIALMDSNCDFDIGYFPFDEQKCNMVFASESYDTEVLDIYLKPGAQHDFNEYQRDSKYLQSASNGEWEAKAFAVTRYVRQSRCCSTPFTHIKLRFTINRIPTFYILYLLCPFVVLSLLVFFSFIIPPDNGERIGFCSSLLLSLSVYLLLFADLMPNNSRNLNVFAVAFVLIFLEAAAVLVATVLVLKAFHATGEIPAVLNLLRCSFFRCRSKSENYPLDQAGRTNTNQACSLNEEEGSLSIRSEAADDNISLADMNQKTGRKQQEIPEKEEDEWTWFQVARRLDRLFYWFFLLVFVVSIAIVASLPDGFNKIEINV